MPARHRLRNRILVVVFAALTSGAVLADSDLKTANVILVTLDGVRVEEMFGGLDLAIARSLAKDVPIETTDLYRKYWAPTPRERRERLMPFFWKTLMRGHGSIAGNRAHGSTVLLTNAHRFSYPGYSEILTGEAHNEKIKSNDRRQNPSPTVLEFLRARLGVDARGVAAFASWDVFNWIVESRRGTITCNAGFEAFEHEDPMVVELSRLQFLTPTPWNSVRHDIYTFSFAKAHLLTWRPRVLYLALGETDDWAHDGRYDRMLEALQRSDSYLADLWDATQRSTEYRGRTTILITTDHGRGRTPDDWRDHGARVEGAQDVWMAFISPDVSLRGEWRDAEPIRTNQIAATLGRFLGVDYLEAHPRAGKSIQRLFEK